MDRIKINKTLNLEMKTCTKIEGTVKHLYNSENGCQYNLLTYFKRSTTIVGRAMGCSLTLVFGV